jgi:hypothetical protein
MAMPKWMQEDIQRRVNSGVLDYNLLNENVKKQIKPREIKPPDLSNYKGSNIGALKELDRSPATLSELRRRDEPELPKAERVARQAKAYHTVGYNVGEDPGYDVFAESDIGKAIAPKSYSFAKGLSGAGPSFGEVFGREQTLGEKGLEFVGALLPIGALSKLASLGVGRTALPRLLPKAVRPAEMALTGAAYEGSKSALEGEPLPKVAKEAATGTALWPAMDLGLGLAAKGLGQAYRAVVRRLGERTNAATADEIAAAAQDAVSKGEITHEEAVLFVDEWGNIRTKQQLDQLALPAPKEPMPSEMHVSPAITSAVRQPSPITDIQRRIRNQRGGYVDTGMGTTAFQPGQLPPLARRPRGYTTPADILSESGVSLPTRPGAGGYRRGTRTLQPAVELPQPKKMQLLPEWSETNMWQRAAKPGEYGTEIVRSRPVIKAASTPIEQRTFEEVGSQKVKATPGRTLN